MASRVRIQEGTMHATSLITKSNLMTCMTSRFVESVGYGTKSLGYRLLQLLAWNRPFKKTLKRILKHHVITMKIILIQVFCKTLSELRFISVTH